MCRSQDTKKQKGLEICAFYRKKKPCGNETNLLFLKLLITATKFSQWKGEKLHVFSTLQTLVANVTSITKYGLKWYTADIRMRKHIYLRVPMCKLEIKIYSLEMSAIRPMLFLLNWLDHSDDKNHYKNRPL